MAIGFTRLVTTYCLVIACGCSSWSADTCASEHAPDAIGESFRIVVATVEPSETGSLRIKCRQETLPRGWCVNEVTDVTDVRGRTKSGYVIAATHVAALDLALARGEVYQTSGLLGVETKRVEHLVFELPDIAGEEVPRVLKSWGKDQTPVAKLIHTENDGYEMILYRLLLKPSRGMRSPDRRDIRRRLVDVAGLPCSEWFVDDSDGRTVARLTLPRETKFGEGIVYRALATSGFFGDP